MLLTRKGALVFFFNNCKGRNYPRIYGIADSFYDLNKTGVQASLAPTFSPGDTCIVAYRATPKDRQIRFTRFRLARVEIKSDEQGKPERVFCGPALQSETLSKADAARHTLYSIFFNKNGDFKQWSVFQR
jgi:hypothetical protein